MLFLGLLLILVVGMILISGKIVYLFLNDRNYTATVIFIVIIGIIFYKIFHEILQRL